MAENDDLYTKRIDGPRQELSDAYSLPANFLEIEVINPETHGVGWRQRYTDYEIKLKVCRMPELLKLIGVFFSYMYQRAISKV